MGPSLAHNVTPEFRVVSGYRRMDNESIEPLHYLGVTITPDIINKDKWEAFWDAPLMVPGTEPGGNAKPPKEGVANQPGLPRKPEEINRATATYQAQSCEVKTNGMRIEVSFPGVQMGVFTGRLQYTVYKGTNLIRQEVIAKTEEPSVAYKYDAGLKGGGHSECVACRVGAILLAPGKTISWGRYRANADDPASCQPRRGCRRSGWFYRSISTSAQLLLVARD